MIEKNTVVLGLDEYNYLKKIDTKLEKLKDSIIFLTEDGTKIDHNIFISCLKPTIAQIDKKNLTETLDIEESIKIKIVD